MLRISDSCRGDSGGGIVSRRLNSQEFSVLNSLFLLEATL